MELGFQFNSIMKRVPFELVSDILTFVFSCRFSVSLPEYLAAISSQENVSLFEGPHDSSVLKAVL